jgi:hypothetical protein
MASWFASILCRPVDTPADFRDSVGGGELGGGGESWFILIQLFRSTLPIRFLHPVVPPAQRQAERIRCQVAPAQLVRVDPVEVAASRARGCGCLHDLQLDLDPVQVVAGRGGKGWLPSSPPVEQGLVYAPY